MFTRIFVIPVSLLGASSLVLAVACTTPAEAKNPPIDTDGPVDCKAEQFKSKEQCFDHAVDACSSLGCTPYECSISRARSSKWVVCDRGNAKSASHLTRCDGIAGWKCPEDTVCRDDPSPGHCKAANSFDCTGLCVPAADAGPPSPGRRP